MRAVVMHETGGPDVLVPEEVPVPTVGAGQVLVRTEAIGVSSGEAQVRAGVFPLPFPLPAVIGAEAAGTVEQLGDGVDPALAGARVVMVTGGVGSYAQFIAVDVAKIARVPDGLSATDAVAAAAPGAMALALLHRADLRGGETVLVEGGSGKVGGYLVRHAREFGARRVVATAGTTAGRDRARGLGADAVVDHANPDWPDGLSDALDGAPLDVAFEAVGGQVAGRILGALTPSAGRMLLYGMLSRQPPALDTMTVMGRGLQIIGCGGPGWFQQVLGVHYPEFLNMAADKRTHLQQVDTVLPLEAAAEAHRRIEDRATSGRIVLSPKR